MKRRKKQWSGLKDCFNWFRIFLRFSGNTSEKAEGRLDMGRKKEKQIDLNNLDPEEKMKYEVAEELGLLDQVLSQGWRSLTSKETGRIGGIVTRKKRERQKEMI